MGFSDFIDSMAFGLIVVGIFVAVFGIPIAVAYLVFSVVSSPAVNSLIRGIIFSLYTVGVFMAGVFIIGSAYESNRKDIMKLIGLCEDKVASISLDVRHCSGSAESKAYDVMTCLKAIEEKI
jgi:hypothetical protein